jgi:Zn-finger nucleic acid-binding protein
MTAQPIARAIIDVCSECGGVWADPEDGDLATVATEARVPDEAGDGPERPPTRCPRCSVRLAPWTAEGVELTRCGKCGGTFLPRESIDGAMWLSPYAGAPAPRAIEGIAAWMRRILGRD